MKTCLRAEISASAVRHNLSLLRDRLDSATRLCAVVKADCYSHGLNLLLPLLQRSADWLAVATPAEAIRLRELGYQGPALVFFPPQACGSGDGLGEALVELIRRDVTLTLVCGEDLAYAARAAERIRARAQVHVKIDTGMCRSGVLAGGAAAALVRRVRDNPGVRLTGLYTHFATADEADKAFTTEQLRSFLAAVDECGGREGLILHAANSAALIEMDEAHLDMARSGIAIYGCQPSDSLRTHLPLRPALRLSAPLMQIKDIPAGSRCGYGLTYRFDCPARLGLVPIGYADGYPRVLSNRAVMRIRGRYVPVRGRVSMDQVIVELTDVPEAAIGDWVEIISDDPAASHSAENLARLAGTIPYEILSGLGQRRINRVLGP